MHIWSMYDTRVMLRICDEIVLVVIKALQEVNHGRAAGKAAKAKPKSYTQYVHVTTGAPERSLFG